MEFTGTKNYPLLELGLSQIYLNKRKIDAIETWFNPDDLSNFTPLTVHDYGNERYTLTDGHSRAYVAYKAGVVLLICISILTVSIFMYLEMTLAISVFISSIISGEQFTLSEISNIFNRSFAI